MSSRWRPVRLKTPRAAFCFDPDVSVQREKTDAIVISCSRPRVRKFAELWMASLKSLQKHISVIWRRAISFKTFAQSNDYAFFPMATRCSIKATNPVAFVSVVWRWQEAGHGVRLHVSCELDPVLKDMPAACLIADPEARGVHDPKDFNVVGNPVNQKVR